MRRWSRFVVLGLFLAYVVGGLIAGGYWRGGVYITLAILVYMLPLIIASNRRLPNTGTIAAINVVLGWTIIGWFFALMMALFGIAPAQAQIGKVDKQ